MNIDVGKFLRLKNIASSAIESIPADQAAMAGQTLAATYSRVRHEVLELIPEEKREEFERLFADDVHVYGEVIQSYREATRFNAARIALGSLAGWLQGFIEEARLSLEAEAYAGEQVRDDRGVIFGVPGRLQDLK